MSADPPRTLTPAADMLIRITTSAQAHAAWAATASRPPASDPSSGEVEVSHLIATTAASTEPTNVAYYLRGGFMLNRSCMSSGLENLTYEIPHEIMDADTRDILPCDAVRLHRKPPGAIVQADRHVGEAASRGLLVEHAPDNAELAAQAHTSIETTWCR